MSDADEEQKIIIEARFLAKEFGIEPNDSSKVTQIVLCLERILANNEDLAFEYFLRRYRRAYPYNGMDMARALSGRLRQLDKKVKSTKSENERLKKHISEIINQSKTKE